MTEEFVVGLRPQRVWNSLVAWDLFLNGTGAGLFVMAYILQAYAAIPASVAALGAWIGLACTATSGLVLLVDLGAPSRFWNVFRRPWSSWVSRGAWTMLLFLAVGSASLVPSLPGLESLPWGRRMLAISLVEALALLLACGLMTYTGLVLSSWNAIAFWNTPLLPVLFIISCLLGAVGILVLLAALVGAETAFLAVLGLGLIGAVAFMLLLYLVVMGGGPVSARESVRRLLSGPEAPLFLVGVLVVGLLIPALFLVVALAFGSGVAWLGTATTSILAGSLLLRQAMLRAGVYRA